MPDLNKLTYLLQLLDDESEVTRKAIAKELAAFGMSLNQELAKLSSPPTAYQRQLMH